MRAKQLFVVPPIMDIASTSDIFSIELKHVIQCTHTQYNAHSIYTVDTPSAWDTSNVWTYIPNTSGQMVMNMFLPISTVSFVCKHVIVILSTH